MYRLPALPLVPRPHPLYTPPMLRAAITILVCLTLSGCAHREPMRPRAARALMVLGAMTTVVGVTVATGCTDVSGEGGCSAGPGAGDIALGIPLIAAGVGMFVVGVRRRPAGVSPSFYSAPAQTNPDPFVQPISQ